MGKPWENEGFSSDNRKPWEKHGKMEVLLFGYVKISMENYHFDWENSLQMAMLNSYYVKSPKGNHHKLHRPSPK